MACVVDKCDRWVKVRLQKATTPTDGETNPTYTDVKDAYAIIRGRMGMEQTRGQQMQAVGMFEIVLYYDEDIQPRWRIKHNSLYYNLTSVWDVDGQRQWLKCTAKQEQP